MVAGIPGEGASTRVPIGIGLLEQEDFPFGIPPAVSTPKRLRLEIEIWLCRNQCAGWILIRESVRLDRPTLDFPVYRINYFVDFADPNDAFWFRMSWT